MQKLPFDRPWEPELNWDCNAGRVVDALLKELLSEGGDWLVNIFGSAPLQIAYASNFLSADVDASVAWNKEPEFDRAISRAGLARGSSPVYVQHCKEAAFRTSPKWKDRACVHRRDSVTIRFAHPIDILIGKIHRLEPKDLKAFELVRAITGEPTETALLQELRDAPDLFSLAHVPAAGEKAFSENVAILWPLFFGREIDVEGEITTPARAILKRNYDQGTDFKSGLRM